MALKQWHKTDDKRRKGGLKLNCNSDEEDRTNSSIAFSSMERFLLTWPASMQIYWKKKKAFA